MKMNNVRNDPNAMSFQPMIALDVTLLDIVLEYWNRKR